MKKVCLFLILCIFVNTLIPLNFINVSASSEDNITYLSYGNYSGTIKEIEGKDCERKFEITEFGNTYTLAIDTLHNKVTINDTKTYTMEAFNEAMQKQNAYVNENSNARSIAKYDLETILNDYPSPRCTTCGKYSPNYAPTSGYGTLKQASRIMNQSIELGFTAACIAAAVIILSISGAGVVGAMTTAQATTIMKKASLIGYNVGTHFKAYYKQWTAYHSSCPKAAYTRRVFYLDANAVYATGVQTDTFYYFTKPY